MMVTIEVAILEHFITGISLHVQVLLKYDLSLGDGTGLVGAQYIHRSEVLDGIEALDNDFLLRHVEGALGQVDRHDHGQHFGGQPNSYCHGKQKCFQPVVFAETIDQEDSRNHNGYKTNHEPGEFVYPLVEASQLALTYNTGCQ